MHSWRVLLLPFLSDEKLYVDYKFDEPWDSPNNKKLLSRRPSVYAFPGDDSDGGTVTNYLAVVGAETAWPGAKSTKIKDIRDGTSLTIFVVENEGSGIQWTEPRDLDFSKFDLMLKDPVRHGISSKLVPPAVQMGDGTTKTVPQNPKPDILKAFFTIAGGEKIGEDEWWQEIPDGRQRSRKDK